MSSSNSSTMRLDLIPEISGSSLFKNSPATNKANEIAPKDERPSSSPEPAIAHQPVPDRYGELFNNLYDAALITDLNGRIRDVNPRAFLQFNYSKAQFTHQTIFKLIENIDLELIQVLFENLRRERFTLLQTWAIRADGSRFHAEVTVSLLKLSTPHLCFLVRDETQRYETNMMLLTEHKALQNASDAIVVINQNSEIEYTNPAVAAIWGFPTATELLKRPLGILFYEPNDSFAILRSLVGETYQISGSAIAKRADGDTFHVEIHAASNRDADGNVVGAVISFTDRTDRERFENTEHDIQELRNKICQFARHHSSAANTLADLNQQLAEIARYAVNNPDKEQNARIQNAFNTLSALETIIAENGEKLDEIMLSPPISDPSITQKL